MRSFLVHIFNAAYVQPVHPAGVELVCKIALDALASLPLHPLAAGAPDVNASSFKPPLP
jgi:hypothetical protein